MNNKVIEAENNGETFSSIDELEAYKAAKEGK
jgi:hypothetical protein